jgi:hypothetical protein
LCGRDSPEALEDDRDDRLPIDGQRDRLANALIRELGVLEVHREGDARGPRYQVDLDVRVRVLEILDIAERADHRIPVVDLAGAECREP